MFSRIAVLSVLVLVSFVGCGEIAGVRSDLVAVSGADASAEGAATVDAGTGANEGGACRAEETICTGACVDLLTDPKNCGACGTVCAPDLVCNRGVCGVTCSAGLENCGGACVDVETDESHCGGCSDECSSGETCVSGNCTANHYTVGGALSGLTSGSVIIRNNGTDDLVLNANGNFTFPKAVADAATYEVTIKQQPPGHLCTVSNPSGTVKGANVTNVAVGCVKVYTIGGNVSGLVGGQTLVLQNNGGDNLTTSNGTFTFATALPTGAKYAVTVQSKPLQTNCTVANGSGTVVTANVTDVSVTCSAF